MTTVGKAYPVATNKFIGWNIVGNKYAQEQQIRSAAVRLFFGDQQEAPIPELPSESDPLYGPILKLRVANDEIKKLDRLIKGVANSKRNGVRFDDKSNPIYKLARLIVKKKPSPTWSVQIGEIIHNLRSALDIAVTQLSKGRPRKPEKPSFPIFQLNTTVRTRKKGGGLIAHFAQNGRRTIAHLRPEHRAIIEAAQPYHAGRYRYRRPLWILHELSNADKHSILVCASVAIGGSEYQFPGVPAICLVGMQFHTNVPFEHDAILARFPREVQVKPKYELVVRFGKRCGRATGKKVIDTLWSLEKEVRQILSALNDTLPH